MISFKNYNNNHEEKEEDEEEDDDDDIVWFGNQCKTNGNQNVKFSRNNSRRNSLEREKIFYFELEF